MDRGTRIQQIDAIAIVIADAQDLNAAGNKISYTVPQGMVARVVGSTFVPSAAGGTIELRITRGATVITLRVDTAAALHSVPIHLSAGDVITWNVTVVWGAGVTGDFSLSIDEMSFSFN